MGADSDISSDSNLPNQNRDKGIEGTDGDHDPPGGEATDIGPSAPDAVDEQPTQFSRIGHWHEDVFNPFKDGLILDIPPVQNVHALPHGFSIPMVFEAEGGQAYWNYQDSDTDEDDDADNNSNPDVEAAHEGTGLPSGAEAVVPWMSEPDSESAAPSEGEAAVPDEKDMVFKSFKKFDTVECCPDHYYLVPKMYSSGAVGSVVKGDIKKKMTMELVKRIHHEWRLLESGLPETIFVRASEDRMDFLRAVIIGPSGTPYQDGLFFFDVCFPEEYPSMPPLVYYHSHGLRLNPNLYHNGYVCLSLLNTWTGTGCENWTPESTVLQVLLSIQALVLNEKPFYNEPENEYYANTPGGRERKSSKYSQVAYLDSCRTMLYLIRKPPPNFEDFVPAYFRKAGKAILQSLRSFMNDDRISSLSDDVGKKPYSRQFNRVGDHEGGSQLGFKAKVQKLFDDILMEFSVKGADCGEFFASGTSGGPAGPSDHPPQSGLE